NSLTRRLAKSAKWRSECGRSCWLRRGRPSIQPCRHSDFLRYSSLGFCHSETCFFFDVLLPHRGKFDSYCHNQRKHRLLRNYCYAEKNWVNFVFSDEIWIVKHCLY